MMMTFPRDLHFFFSLWRFSGPRKRNAINRGIKIDGFEAEKEKEDEGKTFADCRSMYVHNIP